MKTQRTTIAAVKRATKTAEGNFGVWSCFTLSGAKNKKRGKQIKWTRKVKEKLWTVGVSVSHNRNQKAPIPKDDQIIHTKQATQIACKCFLKKTQSCLLKKLMITETWVGSQSGQGKVPLFQRLWDSDRWDSGAESSALQSSLLSDKHLISL